MDDCNFQQQLHALKERVSELSCKYSPGVRPYDPFADQLYDLKAHMASMQNRLTQYERTMQPVRFNLESEASPVGNKSVEARNWSTLPSGPVFWQLFESLRTDVQSLDSRVASLESNISDLEDRVDGLDPNRFTPPGSTTGSEGNPVFNLGGANTVGYMPYSNVQELASDATFKDTADHNQYSVATEKFDQPLYPLQSSPLHTKSYLWSDPLHPQLKDKSVLNRGRGLHQDNKEPPQAWQDTVNGHRRRLSFMSSGPEPPIVTQQSPTEGLAFRDREIARLDEQLRIVQDRLRASDEALVQKQALVVQLQHEREDWNVASRDWAARNYELKEQVFQYCGRAQAKDAEINDLHNQLEERAHVLQEWDESWTRLNEAYHHANSKVQACERNLREERERSESTIDRLIHDHEAKMKALQNFCEQKDVVIYKQEQIIARGGKLLEQREDEIDGLQRELRSLRDDKEHALRETRRTARLLEERDAELSQLKEVSKSRGATRNDAEVFRRHSRPRHSHRTRGEELDRADNARHHDSQGSGASGGITSVADALDYWTRRINKLDNREKPTREYEQSGSAKEDSRRFSGTEKRRGRAEESDRGLPYRSENRDNAHTGLPPSAVGGETITQPINAEGLHQGPLVDRPPLPAPVLPARPRHVSSEANLRTNNAIPARKSLSKYQSMNELRGRNLQAYVESDAEGGEFGGEV